MSDIEFLNIECRPRRLRAKPALRALVAQTDVTVRNLIQPYFLGGGAHDKTEIQGFTDVYLWGVDVLTREIEADLECGVKNFLLFGSSSERDTVGSAASSSDCDVAKALRLLRSRFGNDAVFFTDVCLCSYTSHGHCGVVSNGQVENDKTVLRLAEVACTHADAGADFVAPSDMMDGRIGSIRTALDAAGFASTGILSYCAKYASGYYGPFRNALDCSPERFDRSGYQMDPRNRKEAALELELDIRQGADCVMVKPALAYLDIIADFAARSTVPVFAYSVSGEYQMVKEMARAGLADERTLAVENLTAIRRAGAQAVVTYYASTMARQGWL